MKHLLSLAMAAGFLAVGFAPTTEANADPVWRKCHNVKVCSWHHGHRHCHWKRICHHRHH